MSIKLETWKICCFSDLAFFKLVSGFGNLEIIKLENLAAW